MGGLEFDSALDHSRIDVLTVYCSQITTNISDWPDSLIELHSEILSRVASFESLQISIIQSLLQTVGLTCLGVTLLEPVLCGCDG